MRVHLIVGFTPLASGDGVLTVCDGWDEYAHDSNRVDYNAAVERAADDYGWRYVREAVLDVDVDAGMFDASQAELIDADLRLIWRIENGDLELVTAWDADAIADNPRRFQQDVTEDRRVTAHRIDMDALRAAFEPVKL